MPENRLYKNGLLVEHGDVGGECVWFDDDVCRLIGSGADLSGGDEPGFVLAPAGGVGDRSL